MTAKSAMYEIVMRIKTELGNSMADMNAFASKAKAKLTEVDKVSKKVGKGGVGMLPMGFPGPLPGPDVIKTRGRKKRAGTGPGDIAQMGQLTTTKEDIQRIIESNDALLNATRIQYGPGKKGGQAIKAQHKNYLALDGMMHQVTHTATGLGHNLRGAAMGAQIQSTVLTALQPVYRYTNTRMEDHGRISRSISNTYDEMNNQYRLTGVRIKDVERPHERFKMHLLSLMFFGMAVKAMFMGYIQQVLQLTGVTDLLSATINLLLLPAILPFLPMMYEMLISIMELSPEIRQLLGLSLIALTVAGAILMTIGMVGLGFQGIKIALVECGLAASTTTSSFVILKTIGKKIYNVIIGVIRGLTMAKAILTVVIIGAIVNAKDIIWEGLKLILGGIWHIFEGVYEIVEGAFEIMWGIITGDTDKITDGVIGILGGLAKIVFQGIGYIVTGVFEVIVGLVIGVYRLGINLLSIVAWIHDGIISFVLQILTDLTGIDFIGMYKSYVKDVDNFLFKPLRELIEGFASSMTRGFDGIRSSLDDLTGVFNHFNNKSDEGKKKNEKTTKTFGDLGEGVDKAKGAVKELNSGLDNFFNTTLTDSTEGIDDQTSALSDTTWGYKDLNTGVKESTKSIYDFTGEAKDNAEQLRQSMDYAVSLKDEVVVLGDKFDFANTNLDNFGDTLNTTRDRSKELKDELAKLTNELEGYEGTRAKLYGNSSPGSADEGLSFATGGVVPGPKGRAVRATVHGGETVVPAGGGMGASVNITVNVDSPQIQSNVDIGDLADEISRSMTRELRRTNIL